jgi:hypothetical protein
MMRRSDLALERLQHKFRRVWNRSKWGMTPSEARAAALQTRRQLATVQNDEFSGDGWSWLYWLTSLRKIAADGPHGGRNR